ncbi:hypothetical protein TPHA_0G03710 [Tetrapisispora phaffii CBS 4417]|uniref:Reduced meiotic recombination protein 1 n=1 Tax=Tetrapisispora phaffii (strain ATCC 24235 / CBS 4417 / NBRC 1672 / NRRL Y-8282 / UCD 70-5) TaxID=1071381 RepID=G8BWD3_TETPH|nr:hypothetical protein TPHA_0G03710 [Tetrapisispora phaffii CBS 4417]CCE64211.1 hypothetical protein TPHA_0G03710 [Tetrapisispora phaffii CBS 4417]
MSNNNLDVQVRLEDTDVVGIKPDTESRIQEIEDIDVDVEESEPIYATKSDESLQSDSLVNDDYENEENAINGVDISSIAAQLLQSKSLPKIVIRYENTDFLLFNCDDSNDEVISILCEDVSLVNAECLELLKHIRLSLERYYGKLAFMSKEMYLHIPSLDLTINEDNLYNNKISMNDIISIYEILRGRSLDRNEANVPDHLLVELKLRQRFLNRYNSLVELTENDEASLLNIVPFSNNQSDPVVLEDD